MARSTCGRKLMVVSAPEQSPSAVIMEAPQFVQLLYKPILVVVMASGQEVEPGRDALSQLVTLLHVLGGTASRAELTERLGCGRSVMGYLLGDLASRGVVTIEQAVGNGRAGRPSHQVRVAETAPAVIAVQLQVDTVTVATITLAGQI